MIFTMKMPCPSSNSMKIKTLFRSHIFPHLWPFIKALTKAKSMVKDLLNNNNKKSYSYKNRHKKNMLYGSNSIRLHYNWCSSQVLPMPEPAEDGLHSCHTYYDSTWNSVIEGGDDCDEVAPELSGYLRWLEEKHAGNSTEEVAVDEIDRLADMFIANCHEKFRLEKQESYRRYQEMLARSM